MKAQRQQPEPVILCANTPPERAEVIRTAALMAGTTVSRYLWRAAYEKALADIDQRAETSDAGAER